MLVKESVVDDKGRTSIYLVYHQGFVYDLVFSPDDHGFYFQRHADDYTSNAIYKNKKAALTALSNDTVDWSH